MVVFGADTNNIGFVDLKTEEVIEEIELSHIFQTSIEFNDKYYILLTTEDDDDRKLLEIPFDPNEDYQLIEFETNGRNSFLDMNIVDDILHITANSHYIQIKE